MSPLGWNIKCCVSLNVYGLLSGHIYACTCVPWHLPAMHSMHAQLSSRCLLFVFDRSLEQGMNDRSRSCRRSTPVRSWQHGGGGPLDPSEAAAPAAQGCEQHRNSVTSKAGHGCPGAVQSKV